MLFESWTYKILHYFKSLNFELYFGKNEKVGLLFTLGLIALMA